MVVSRIIDVTVVYAEVGEPSDDEVTNADSVDAWSVLISEIIGNDVCTVDCNVLLLLDVISVESDDSDVWTSFVVVRNRVDPAIRLFVDVDVSSLLE